MEDVQVVRLIKHFVTLSKIMAKSDLCFLGFNQKSMFPVWHLIESSYRSDQQLIVMEINPYNRK